MEDSNIFKYLHFSHPTKEQETVLKAMESFTDEKDPYDFLVLCGAVKGRNTTVNGTSRLKHGK